jgi:hypothetical protein
MATIWVIGFFGIMIIFIIMAVVSCETINSHEDRTRQMNGDPVSCTVDDKPSDECPPLASLLPLLPGRLDQP